MNTRVSPRVQPRHHATSVRSALRLAAVFQICAASLWAASEPIPSAVVLQPNSAITVDAANGFTEWANVDWVGAGQYDTGMTSRFALMWDSFNLYLYAVVTHTDPHFYVTSTDSSELASGDFEAVHLSFNTSATPGGSADRQFYFGFVDGVAKIWKSTGLGTGSEVGSCAITERVKGSGAKVGLIYEASIPWSELGLSPSAITYYGAFESINVDSDPTGNIRTVTPYSWKNGSHYRELDLRATNNADGNWNSRDAGTLSGSDPGALPTMPTTFAGLYLEQGSTSDANAYGGVSDTVQTTSNGPYFDPSWKPNDTALPIGVYDVFVNIRKLTTGTRNFTLQIKQQGVVITKFKRAVPYTGTGGVDYAAIYLGRLVNENDTTLNLIDSSGNSLAVDWLALVPVAGTVTADDAQTALDALRARLDGSDGNGDGTAVLLADAVTAGCTVEELAYPQLNYNIAYLFAAQPLPLGDPTPDQYGLLETDLAYHRYARVYAQSVAMLERLTTIVEPRLSQMIADSGSRAAFAIPVFDSAKHYKFDVGTNYFYRADAYTSATYGDAFIGFGLSGEIAPSDSSISFPGELATFFFRSHSMEGRPIPQIGKALDWSTSKAIIYKDDLESGYGLILGDNEDGNILTSFMPGIHNPNSWMNNDNYPGLIAIYQDSEDPENDVLNAYHTGFFDFSTLWEDSSFGTTYASDIVNWLDPYYTGTLGLVSLYPDTVKLICLENELYMADISANAQTPFVDWLTTKYTTISNLNTAWGTSYASFANIPTIPSTPDAFWTGMQAMWFDFNLFSQDKLAVLVESMQEKVEDEFPDSWTHIKLTTRGFEDGGADVSVDRETLNDIVDVVGLDGTINRTLEIELDLARSLLATKKPLYNSEYHCIKLPDSEQKVHGTVWNDTMHGQALASLWKAGYYDLDKRENDLVNNKDSDRASLYNAEGFAGYCRAALDMQRLASKVAPFWNQAPSVAIYYSMASKLVRPSATAANTFIDESLDVYNALRYAGIQVEFVSDAQIGTGKLSSYSYVFVPSANYVPDATFASLSSYAVTSGKNLVVVGPALAFDDYSKSRSSPAITGAITWSTGSAIDYLNHLDVDANMADLRTLNPYRVKDDANTDSPFGVEWKYISVGGVGYLYVQNLGELDIDATLPFTGTDLISQRAVSSTAITLAPHLPYLIQQP